MKYVGSKARIAKYILPLIIKDRQQDQWYIEPFVGGANSICLTNGNRYGSDNNPYVIALLQAIQRGWVPPDNITEDEYYRIKNNQSNYELHYIGYVGFCCSYSGKFWGGYARGEGRNYCLEAKKHLLKQRPQLQGIIFNCCHYMDNKSIPPNSIIYCDPPYQGTTRYYKNNFDHNVFWQWCKEQTLAGHKVFVSEYNAPPDWQCIWSRQIVSSLTQDTGSKLGIERLFVYKGE